MAHLQQWFANHDECPTGCGCVCAKPAGFSALPTPAKEGRATSADRGSMAMGASTRTGEAAYGVVA